MRIICEKGHSARQILQLAAAYIEKLYSDDAVLANDVEIEISGGESGSADAKTVHLGQKALEQMPHRDDTRDYYQTDVLTGLYNRNKYEQDLTMLQTAECSHLTCIYIDAVGLHEINNHLGHQAGDDMLCCIADGIRHHFPTGSAYRIGGDEFVILCLDLTQKDAENAVFALKQEVRQREYEISAGIAESTDSSLLNDMINGAENAMRIDKADFYRNNGGLRQMRSLNHRLEKLLIEKQDASHFLNVIAPRYKGVYMVNTEKDTCRYIYVPPYFQTMLDRNNGIFSRSMKDYCRELVQPEYYDRFTGLFDYDQIRERIAAGQAVDFVYRKRDGNWIELKITGYAQGSADSHEMLWIFTDENDRVPAQSAIG